MAYHCSVGSDKLCFTCPADCNKKQEMASEEQFDIRRERNHITKRCHDIIYRTQEGVLQPREVDMLKVGDECHEECNHCTNKPIENILQLSEQEQLHLISRIQARYPDSRLFVYPDEIINNRHLIGELVRHSQDKILTSATDRDFMPDDPLLQELLAVGITDIPVTLFASPEEQQEITNQSRAKYERIIKNIHTLVSMGFRVRANNVLHKKNIDSMPAMIHLASRLGVAEIRFTELRYLGRGRNMDPSYFLTEDDVFRVVQMYDQIVSQYPKEEMAIILSPTSFGPRLYGLTPTEASEKIRRKKKAACHSPDDYPYPCSTIDNQYLAYNFFSGDLHWCYMTIADREERIGSFNPETGEIIIDSPVDFTVERLHEEIHGICGQGECQYHDSCLGMCRSTAASYALLRGEKNPHYASMPFCQTKIREKLYGSK